jgi:hypothetical protein
MYGLFRNTRLLNRYGIIKPFKFSFGSAGHGHDHGHGQGNQDYHPKRFDKTSLARELGKGEREE